MRIKYFLFYFILSFNLTAQELLFQAQIESKEIAQNKTVELNFVINTQEADNFTPPNLKNFNHGAPVVGHYSSNININGKITKKSIKFYKYTLKPTKIGVLTIGSATIECKGQKLKTKPIQINVTKPVINPNDPNYIAEQNIEFVATVSNRKPYIGEAIYLEYKIYHKNLEINSIRDFSKPAFKGFRTKEIRTEIKTEKVKYKGSEWNCSTLQKIELKPNNPGKFKISKAALSLFITIYTGREDFYGNPEILDRLIKTFNSNEIGINVKEPPLKNRPEIYAGAIGDFKFKVSLNKNQLNANESAEIEVNVSGKGNFKSFKLPKLQIPSELESYEPEKKIKLNINGNGISNAKYTITPVYKGKFKIPGLEFCYFNPKDEKYHLLKSDDLFINVLEGQEIQSISKSISKANVKNTGTDFKFIQPTTNLKPLNENDFFKSKFYFLSLLLPLLLIPLVVMVIKKRESYFVVHNNKKNTASRLVKKHLKVAKKNLGNKESFYESLEIALHNFLKAKLEIETSEITRSKITELLEKKNVQTKTIENFINTLKNCDFARYTPITDVEMKSEYERAKEILIQLDKQL